MMGGGTAPTNFTKTALVLGAAYGGARAAQLLAAGLPKHWRLIVIDRNTHANHVYVMPRYAVLPGHEYKAFIPYTNVFQDKEHNPQHIVIQAHVLSLRPNHVTISRAFPELGIPSTTIPFDYAIYALGSHLPAPLDLWGKDPSATYLDEGNKVTTSVKYNGLKSEGVDWFKEKQKVVESSPTVLVVGGGALGVQFATDIKAVYPEKKVTLLHSRQRLLPRFDEGMHNEIRMSMEDLNIEVILGERLDLGSIEEGKAEKNNLGQRAVRTVIGREIAADLLLLCTGQKPNTGLLAGMDPATVNPENNLAHVLRTMQLSTKPVDNPDASVVDGLKISESGQRETTPVEEPVSSYPHIFAIGDTADAFGAIAAGYNAYAQGEVAARNIVRLVKRQEAEGGVKGEEEPLEEYTPGPPAIKVSLGLTRSVYQVGPAIGVKTDGQPDLQAALIWPYYGIKVEKDEDMIH